MIWKGRINGETRFRRKFAVLPNKLDNGYWIWLDWYWAKEEYHAWRYNNPPGWVEAKTGFTEGYVR